MIRYPRRYWALAAGLSAIAGFVDSIAFLKLGGFFVSFMSGNSTRLGAGLALAPQHAAVAAGLIASFVFGVMLGGLAAGKGDAKSGFRVLALVTPLLAAAALCGDFRLDGAAVSLLAVAMGAENAVFRRNGEVTIGLTYMTGALVKLGHGLADALRGGPRFAWLPYLSLWAGLIAGAAGGALAYAQFGLRGVWIAAAAAAALSAVWRKFSAGGGA